MTFGRLVAAILTAAAIIFVFLIVVSLVLLWTNYPWAASDGGKAAVARPETGVAFGDPRGPTP